MAQQLRRAGREASASRVPALRQSRRPHSQAETALQVLGPSRPRGRLGLDALVEAAGIEPASGNPWRQASTSIAGFLLLSPPGTPTGWISGRPASRGLAPHPETRLRASHQSMTP